MTVGLVEALLSGDRPADTVDAVTAGLVDNEGVCVNAILVRVDASTGQPIGYAPPGGLALVVHRGAGVGRIWNGTAFVDREI